MKTATPRDHFTFLLLLLAVFVFLTLDSQVTIVSADPPRFPNIGYVAYGYNIFLGNPHSTNTLDPGFGNDVIFNLTYVGHWTTADGLWSIPDDVSVPGTTDSCAISSEGVVCQSVSDYVTDLEADCSTDFTNFGAAFSASPDFKHVQNDIDNEGSVFVSTQGSCEVYRAYINIDLHPGLIEKFESVASELPMEYNVSTASAFWNFFDLYGTHYITQISFGARWGFLFEVSSSQWSILSTSGLNVGEAASYDGLYIHAGVQTNNTNDLTEAQLFDSYTEGFSQFSLGNPPPSDGSLDDWEDSTVHSSVLSAIGYELLTIDQVFQSAFTSNKALPPRQPAVSQALQDYCSQYLLPNNIVPSC